MSKQQVPMATTAAFLVAALFASHAVAHQRPAVGGGAPSVQQGQAQKTEQQILAESAAKTAARATVGAAVGGAAGQVIRGGPVGAAATVIFKPSQIGCQAVNGC